MWKRALQMTSPRRIRFESHSINCLRPIMFQKVFQLYGKLISYAAAHWLVAAHSIFEVVATRRWLRILSITIGVLMESACRRRRPEEVFGRIYSAQSNIRKRCAVKWLKPNTQRELVGIWWCRLELRLLYMEDPRMPWIERAAHRAPTQVINYTSDEQCFGRIAIWTHLRGRVSACAEELTRGHWIRRSGYSAAEVAEE